MLFHTIEFILLFILVAPFAIWGNSAIRRFTLLAASYIFYMWFSIPLVSLLIFSTLLDFYVGQALYNCTDQKKRKLFLILSLTGNLGVLFVFKYFNFFTSSISSLTTILFNSQPLPYYDIILPIGISFYTFQTLSYTIDIYRGKMKPTNSLLTFALYVAFFPQLVAGPIVRASALIPQLIRGPYFAQKQFKFGLGLFIFGLVKKVVIADNLAVYANKVFILPNDYMGINVLLGIYAFAFQIYCDFSGYTDMARGIAFLLGYDLGLNFNFPYFARSIREFWHRWHISLSTWLRDYLYISLGGNKCSQLKNVRNIMVVMLLGGLWHGANWTFVIWGGLHGIWVTFEHIWNKLNIKRNNSANISPALRLLQIILTFHGVCLTWIFFRANSLEQALLIMRNLFTGNSGPLVIDWTPLFYIATMIIVDLIYWKSAITKWLLKHSLIYWMAIVLGVFTYLIFGNMKGDDFVYFQF